MCPEAEERQNVGAYHVLDLNHHRVLFRCNRDDKSIYGLEYIAQGGSVNLMLQYGRVLFVGTLKATKGLCHRTHVAT